MEVLGNSKKFDVARYSGSGGQYLGMGLESKVKEDRSWKVLWPKLRENYFALREKQCKG